MMNNQIKLTDFPINIDTVCFKLNVDLAKKCYSDWENKYKFYQTIRFINGSRVSIRYYSFYRCLSVYVDSLTGLLYGNSQVLYQSRDYLLFKRLIADLINSVTGLNEFEPDIFDYAKIVRFDINQDYYFSSKNNERKFREWLSKFCMPYAKSNKYASGYKNGTKSTNITCYSKDEQLKTKYKEFNNPYDKRCFCTRMEFQIKANYWKSEKLYLINALSNSSAKDTYFNLMLNKVHLCGTMMNSSRFYNFVKKIQQNKRKDCAKNIKNFYYELSKKGFNAMKKMPSYKNYIKYSVNMGKIPIKLDDSVYKEIVELKDIYYSENF